MKGVFKKVKISRGGVDLSGKEVDDKNCLKVLKDRVDTKGETVSELDLTGNLLTQLPEELGTLLPNLVSLRASKNNLIAYPDVFFRLLHPIFPSRPDDFF